MLPPDFDVEGYRKYNPDIAKYSNEWLQEHYVKCGLKQKRLYKLNLPEDFNLEIYRYANKDLEGFSDEQLQKHFSLYGYNEQRIYRDKYFDKDFFIQYNSLSKSSTYLDYVLDVRQIKSKTIQEKINQIPNLSKRAVLVSHKSSLNGATHSLYLLASYLKQKNNPFIILETTPNVDFLLKYDLDQSDFLYYEDDPTLLYWMCVSIPSTRILFNSINFAMTEVMKWIERKQLILFSREIKEHYMKRSYYEPDFVITNKISDSYLSKPKVQTPILLPSLIEKMDKCFTVDVEIPKLDKNKITIGMCGTICERKNHLLFLQVAEKLPEYNFVWIGGAHTSENLVNVYHVEDTNNPYAYYKLLDYFVLFSEQEPFGNVVIENLYFNNAVLTFKDNIFYDHKCKDLKELYFEYDGKITLQSAVSHIKTVCKKKTNKKNVYGQTYVVNRFTAYKKDFIEIWET